MSGINYLDEHLHCSNYQKGDECIFQPFDLKAGYRIVKELPKGFSFIFVMQGALDLLLKGKKPFPISENNMYSLDYKQPFELEVKEDAQFILLSFERPKIMCDEFNLMKLKGYLPDRKEFIPSLPIREPLQNYLKQLKFYMDNMIMCQHLYDIKQSEWFFLMRCFYTKEENGAFFYRMISGYNDFLKHVSMDLSGIDTVSDLADKFNMSTKTLTRNFKKYFDETPKQWMQKRRMQSIKLEIYKSNNISELHNKLGFSSYSHLNDYCEKYFGKSISELKSEREKSSV
ncbi:MAG: helix-turn-helix domain-containing protein [Fermentimonas sp.]|jgi:AraC-like DNA-binding protein